MIAKEIEVSKKEFMHASAIKSQADLKRNELLRRVEEEKELINTLRDIVKKLNKEITNTTSDKDRLRQEFLKQEKMKEQLQDKIVKTYNESQLFYKRAHKNIYS